MGSDEMHVQTAEQVVQESRQVLACRDAADGPGQDVIEHQRGDRKFRERAAHRLLDYAIDAPAHKHAAALDVHGPHSVGEQHDAQDEPGRCLADGLFGDCSRIEGGGAKIIEYDGGRPPERDEGQHGGRRKHDPWQASLVSCARRLWNAIGGHISLSRYSRRPASTRETSHSTPYRIQSIRGKNPRQSSTVSNASSLLSGMQLTA